MDRFLKRVLDILAAAGLLVLFAPLLGGVALAVARQKDGPVLFCQTRPGKDEKPFVCRKFRSMRAPAFEGEPDMPRITKLGRFLRRYSLDELPQLWNIFVGEMSFVGPRPLLPEYLPCYTREQARRHSVRPGLTGWAQANGRNALEWNDRLAMDVWYVEHRTLVLDMKIFAMTLRQIVTGEGLNRSNAMTAENFSEYVKQREVRKP
ncbi:MAG: sugar transferase [Oscillospiraceae bacterium]|jgi:lipopolysaccharide/colanic/teichoic acid biosynthesis glycosyltransferase|nr:sugar transferase [Oscillospiraceae bacterium]